MLTHIVSPPLIQVAVKRVVVQAGVGFLAQFRDAHGLACGYFAEEGAGSLDCS